MTIDEQLLTRVEGGDVGALGAIYDRYGDLCLRSARHWGSEPAFGDDAVLFIFMRL